MKALSRLGVGLAVVSALLLLALTAELYYIFVYKRRLRRRAAAISDAASSPSSSSRELLQLFCFKKPPALASTYTVQEPHAAGTAVTVTDDDEQPGRRPAAAAVHHQGGDQGGPRVRGRPEQVRQEPEPRRPAALPRDAVPHAGVLAGAAVRRGDEQLLQPAVPVPNGEPEPCSGSVATAQVPVPQGRGGEDVPAGAGRGGHEDAEVAAASSDAVVSARRGGRRVHHDRGREEQPRYPAPIAVRQRWPSVSWKLLFDTYHAVF